MSGGGDEVDGTAQCSGSILQAIRSFIDFGVTVGRGVDALKVAAAVGGVIDGTPSW